MKIGKAAAVLGMVCLAAGCSVQQANATNYAMSTIVSQTVWAKNPQEVCEKVQQTLTDFENQYSLYRSQSEVKAINDAAGKEPVQVSQEMYHFLQNALRLEQGYEDCFALTMAPVTLAWGVYTESPRVVPSEERAELLELVDDSALKLLEDGTVQLEKESQGLDLGGIAKGAACDVVREVYEKEQVTGALFDLGGNLMAVGRKPDGQAFRVGFRDPAEGQGSAMVSFELYDEAIAVSGGYERFFEADGKRYAHIFDPKTAAPVESDLQAVGIVCESGMEADFYSTALYVGGLDRALSYMRQGGKALALSTDNVLYVSQALKDTFRWENGKESMYSVEWIEEDAA